MTSPPTVPAVDVARALEVLGAALARSDAAAAQAAVDDLAALAHSQADTWTVSQSTQAQQEVLRLLRLAVVQRDGLLEQHRALGAARGAVRTYQDRR